VSAAEPEVRDAADDRLSTWLGGVEHETVACADGMPTAVLARDALPRAFEALHAAGFGGNTLVTAVDHLPLEPRFEVVWQFVAMPSAERVRLKTRVGEDDPTVPSCVGFWPGAAFSERECFDMFGIRFDGNPDPRRLLMPEEYEHHPLRKDFPHVGIQPDKLYREWDAERRENWSPAP